MANFESVTIKNNDGIPQLIIDGKEQDLKNVRNISIYVDADRTLTVEKTVTEYYQIQQG